MRGAHKEKDKPRSSIDGTARGPRTRDARAGQNRSYTVYSLVADEITADSLSHQHMCPHIHALSTRPRHASPSRAAHAATSAAGAAASPSLAPPPFLNLAIDLKRMAACTACAATRILRKAWTCVHAMHTCHTRHTHEDAHVQVHARVLILEAGLDLLEALAAVDVVEGGLAPVGLQVEVDALHLIDQELHLVGATDSRLGGRHARARVAAGAAAAGERERRAGARSAARRQRSSALAGRAMSRR